MQPGHNPFGNNQHQQPYYNASVPQPQPTTQTNILDPGLLQDDRVRDQQQPQINQAILLDAARRNALLEQVRAGETARQQLMTMVNTTGQLNNTTNINTAARPSLFRLPGPSSVQYPVSVSSYPYGYSMYRPLNFDYSYLAGPTATIEEVPTTPPQETPPARVSGHIPPQPPRQSHSQLASAPSTVSHGGLSGNNQQTSYNDRFRELDKPIDQLPIWEKMSPHEQAKFWNLTPEVREKLRRGYIDSMLNQPSTKTNSIVAEQQERGHYGSHQSSHSSSTIATETSNNVQSGSHHPAAREPLPAEAPIADLSIFTKAPHQSVSTSLNLTNAHQQPYTRDTIFHTGNPSSSVPASNETVTSTSIYQSQPSVLASQMSGIPQHAYPTQTSVSSSSLANALHQPTPQPPLRNDSRSTTSVANIQHPESTSTPPQPTRVPSTGNSHAQAQFVNTHIQNNTNKKTSDAVPVQQQRMFELGKPLIHAANPNPSPIVPLHESGPQTVPTVQSQPDPRPSGGAYTPISEARRTMAHAAVPSLVVNPYQNKIQAPPVVQNQQNPSVFSNAQARISQPTKSMSHFNPSFTQQPYRSWSQVPATSQNRPVASTTEAPQLSSAQIVPQQAPMQPSSTPLYSIFSGTQVAEWFHLDKFGTLRQDHYPTKFNNPFQLVYRSLGNPIMIEYYPLPSPASTNFESILFFPDRGFHLVGLLHKHSDRYDAYVAKFNWNDFSAAQGRLLHAQSRLKGAEIEARIDKTRVARDVLNELKRKRGDEDETHPPGTNMTPLTPFLFVPSKILEQPVLGAAASPIEVQTSKVEAVPKPAAVPSQDVQMLPVSAASSSSTSGPASAPDPQPTVEVAAPTPPPQDKTTVAVVQNSVASSSGDAEMLNSPSSLLNSEPQPEAPAADENQPVASSGEVQTTTSIEAPQEAAIVSEQHMTIPISDDVPMLEDSAGPPNEELAIPVVPDEQYLPVSLSRGQTPLQANISTGGPGTDTSAVTIEVNAPVPEVTTVIRSPSPAPAVHSLFVPPRNVPQSTSNTATSTQPLEPAVPSPTRIAIRPTSAIITVTPLKPPSGISKPQEQVSTPRLSAPIYSYQRSLSRDLPPIESIQEEAPRPVVAQEKPLTEAPLEPTQHKSVPRSAPTIDLSLANAEARPKKSLPTSGASALAEAYMSAKSSSISTTRAFAQSITPLRDRSSNNAISNQKSSIPSIVPPPVVRTAPVEIIDLVDEEVEEIPASNFKPKESEKQRSLPEATTSSTATRVSPHLNGAGHLDVAGPSNEPLFLSSPPAKTNTRVSVPLMKRMEISGSSSSTATPRKMACVLVPERPAWVKKDLVHLNRQIVRDIAEGKKRPFVRNTRTARRASSDEVDLSFSEGEDASDPPGLVISEQDVNDAITLSITAQSDCPCLWDVCEVRMNTAENLSKHLLMHAEEALNNANSAYIRCFWLDCGVKVGLDQVLKHVSAHATMRLYCAYEDCLRSFRNPRKLVVHHKIAHRSGQIGESDRKDSALPFIPEPSAPPAPLPESMKKMPSYLTSTPVVEMPQIRQARHHELMRRVLKNIFGPVDAYDSIMITNGRRTRAGPKAPPAAHDHWDFMAAEIDVYKEIKELDDIDSRAVTRYVIVGDLSSLSDEEQSQHRDELDQEQEWMLQVNDTRQLFDEHMMLSDEEDDDGDGGRDGESSWQTLITTNSHAVSTPPEALTMTTTTTTTVQGGVMNESREEVVVGRHAVLPSSMTGESDGDELNLLDRPQDVSLPRNT